MPTRKKKQSPSAEVFSKYFNNVSVSIMDLSKIDDEIKNLLTTKQGDELDVLLKALVEKYKQS